jgi:hypothetical protein
MQLMSMDISLQIYLQDSVPSPGSWHHTVLTKLRNFTLFFLTQTSILRHANKSYCIPHLEQKTFLPRMATVNNNNNNNNKVHPRTGHKGPEGE